MYVTVSPMAATVVLKIGPIKAKFDGAVELMNLEPPHSYTIQGEGKGGIAADGRIASLQCFGQAVDISPRRHAFKIISLLLP